MLLTFVYLNSPTRNDIFVSFTQTWKRPFGRKYLSKYVIINLFYFLPNWFPLLNFFLLIFYMLTSQPLNFETLKLYTLVLNQIIINSLKYSHNFNCFLSQLIQTVNLRQWINDTDQKWSIKAQRDSNSLGLWKVYDLLLGVKYGPKVSKNPCNSWTSDPPKMEKRPGGSKSVIHLYVGWKINILLESLTSR